MLYSNFNLHCKKCVFKKKKILLETIYFHCIDTNVNVYTAVQSAWIFNGVIMN